jgi:hypothetical protein
MYPVTESSIDFRWNPKETSDLSNPRRTEEARFSNGFPVEPELIFGSDYSHELLTITLNRLKLLFSYKKIMTLVKIIKRS